ncbi:Flp pilus assembly protein CpaB [Arthrobacter sp. KK5.5]|uniref:Flp pilus assembly protein CpaB n=1 Tax=Arthrobacter sp. KK5.5 TaxID=3373084 RepID=UPI003EE6DA89
MRSRLLAGAAALLLALIGLILVYSYAQGADQRAMAGMEPVDVLVVQTPVPEGASLTVLEESVVTSKLPQSAVPDSALRSLEGQEGRVAGTNLVAGEVLVPDRLVDPADLQEPGSVPVPQGMQEVTFALDPQRMVGGKVNAGDTVGVFVSFDDGAVEDDPKLSTTQRVFHQVLVTTVQRAEATADEPAENAAALPAGTMLVTVAVKDVDAAKIVYSAEFGRIWLTKEADHAAKEPPTVIRKSDVYP